MSDSVLFCFLLKVKWLIKKEETKLKQIKKNFKVFFIQIKNCIQIFLLSSNFRGKEGEIYDFQGALWFTNLIS